MWWFSRNTPKVRRKEQLVRGQRTYRSGSADDHRRQPTLASRQLSAKSRSSPDRDARVEAPDVLGFLINRCVSGHGFSRAANGPLRTGLCRLCRNPYWFAGVEGITQNSAPNGTEELSPALQRWVKWEM